MEYCIIANIVYTNIEQRQERTYTLCCRMLDRMEQLDEYYDGIPIVVTGSPEPTQYGGPVSSYLPGELYDMPGVPGEYYVWEGGQFPFAFRNHLGVPFNYQYDQTLQLTIKNTDAYRNMGLWPDKDSVRIIDGTLVIKFQEKDQ